MTLVKWGEFIKPRQDLKRHFVGKVLSVNDPEQLGRVKVIIENYMDGQNFARSRSDAEVKSALPWCSPFESYGLFGKTQYIPEIDDLVKVYFPDEDPHFPFYEGYMVNKNNSLAKVMSSVFGGTDYPKISGELSADGTYIAVNQTKKTIDFKHSSGLRFEVTTTGKCKLTLPEGYEVEIEKNLNLHAKETIKIDSNINIELNGNQVNSARSGDRTTHLCLAYGSPVSGSIVSGNPRVKQGA